MKIKVFTFQQDEIDILEDWIDYHSYLFGRENLYIIDHESINCKGLIKSKGVNLINFTGTFRENKGIELTKLMKENTDSCDFVIPLDVDEFIIKKDGEEISSDKHEIIKCFESLGGCGAYKFASYTVMRHSRHPTTEFKYVTNTPDHGRFKRWKTFWRSRDFIETDQGNHGSEEKPYEYTNLALLHFHNRGFEHFKRKNLRWPKSYGNNKPPETKKENKHHWERVYDIIKDMNEQEMLAYWQSTCNEKEDNSYKYNSFKTTLKKLIGYRHEALDESD